MPSRVDVDDKTPAERMPAGVLRIQINANHQPAAIDGLLEAMGRLQRVIPLPGPDTTRQAA